MAARAQGRLAGADDLEAALAALELRLPAPLRPLARVAHNYRWSWSDDGERLFAAIDPHRWHLAKHNPIRLLSEVAPALLERVAGEAAIVARAQALADALARELADAPALVGGEGTIAFFCAEVGLHRSLPLYSGGLGVLAGDLLKEASDRRTPMIGVSLMYRSGYFHQRVDRSGWQHEYWIDADPERSPAVLVSGADGRPLVVPVTIGEREVQLRVWRVDVGRVPLFLLDAEVPGNPPIDRWITARLYEGNRAIRLAQYVALGIGGVRLLRAIGVEPARIHLNEGHAALAALELAADEVAGGQSFAEAARAVAPRLCFTTHTPVPAGNETYAPGELLEALGDLPARLGLEPQELLDLGRLRPGDALSPAGMTPLAIRLSGAVNGVSRRHGEVARAMWQPLFPGRRADEVPIDHVTNGVHHPTWIAASFRALFDRHLGRAWRERPDDPASWAAVDAIPDGELWAARCAARTSLIDYVRERSVTDRLRRGEALDYVQAAERTLDHEVLTVGFARRLASYKRMRLLIHDPRRALALLRGPRPIQLLLAGKAHPLDEGAKGIVQTLFALKQAEAVAGRVVFLEDYNLSIAGSMVGGADLWINLPIPPQEASGTSGMKSALSGGLQLSVADGWWAEAHDGDNGWAIAADEEADPEARDARDAAALYDLLEHEVVPAFYERDADGLPQRWLAMMRASIKSIAPRYSATRMLAEYRARIYRVGG
ncbi:MAG: alpha-glucan family phosphorylase [Myxococcales bacterium]|nr:alpha-glucan family phosphorylase [Myxococcales bacterium]